MHAPGRAQGQIGEALHAALNLILTILTLMWCVIITKQQGMCCLAPNINVILWTILIWLAVGTIATIIGCLNLIGLAPSFIVVIIVYAIGLVVLVPLTVWSIQASVATCKGGATAEARRPGATVVATPVGVAGAGFPRHQRTRRLAAGRVRRFIARRSFFLFRYFHLRLV